MFSFNEKCFETIPHTCYISYYTYLINKKKEGEGGRISLDSIALVIY
jgi:hypothetical protein